ncbi:MAG: hypothetical protein K8S87_06320 [Planctomycetes bacterium]|nr:hypothetical protein [Planctomycetota bacterium]
MIQRCIVLFSIIAAIFIGCDNNSNNDFITKYGNPLRLVVSPSQTWLDSAGATSYIETYVATDKNNHVFVDSSYSDLNPGFVSITRFDTGKFVIKALVQGKTTIEFLYRIGINLLKAELSVIVDSDVLVLGGFNRANLYEMRSSTGEFIQTTTKIGGDEGVSDFFVFRDNLYTVTSDIVNGDNIEVFTKGSLVKNKTFNFKPKRYAQKLMLVSTERAILLNQLPDANGSENLYIINMQTGDIVEKIVLPNNTGFDLWIADAVIKNDRMFISTTPFDNATWAFRQCYLIVVDLTSKTVIDADPTDPDIDFIALPYENPRRLFLEDDGDLLVLCAGNALSTPKTESAVLIFDTNSFKLKKTLPTGTDGYLGCMPIIDKSGRLYLPDQYLPNLFSFDTINDTWLRNKTTGLTFAPPQAIGFMSGTIVNNVLLLTNPYGYLIQRLNLNDDDNNSAIPYKTYEKYNVNFSHIVSRKDVNRIAYVKKIINPADLPAGNIETRVFGVPNGMGVDSSSSDIIVLGDLGLILGFDDKKCINRPGTDFVVFSAATYRSAGKPSDFDAACWRDMTPARVSVSVDGLNWVEFPATENTTYEIYDPRRYEGYWAGINPTISNSANDYYVENASAGGDRFDLAVVGMEQARYIKVTGKQCKLDSVALLHNQAD